MDVAGFDVGEVLMQNFCHRRAGDVGALFGQSALGKIAACVLGVAEVDVGNDVDYAAVGLLGQALVLAAIAGLHVENGDMKALCSDSREA